MLELPNGADQEAGHDQAEGITLFDPDGGAARQILVVHDATAPVSYTHLDVYKRQGYIGLSIGVSLASVCRAAPKSIRTGV